MDLIICVLLRAGIFWIEGFNKDYKRVLKMRGAMPAADSVIALMRAADIEKQSGTYSYPVSVFREVEEFKRKE